MPNQVVSQQRFLRDNPLVGLLLRPAVIPQDNRLLNPRGSLPVVLRPNLLAGPVANLQRSPQASPQASRLVNPLDSRAHSLLVRLQVNRAVNHPVSLLVSPRINPLGNHPWLHLGNLQASPQLKRTKIENEERTLTFIFVYACKQICLIMQQ